MKHKIISSIILLHFLTNFVNAQSFDTYVNEVKNQNRPILITVTIPERQPQLSPIDPINSSYISCYDGGCKDRIIKNFSSKIVTNSEEIGRELISKYNLKNYPVTLIFDKNGVLITKCNSFMFGNEDILKKIYPIFNDNSLNIRLIEIEKSKQTANATELKKFIIIKDSLYMQDTELVELFVEKAIEKDYTKEVHELLEKSIFYVKSPFEQKLLNNLNQYLKNYKSEDWVEYEQDKLKDSYRIKLFNSLFYSYRTNDETLMNNLINDSKTSVFKSKQAEEVVKVFNYNYSKVIKK